jgi:hypothetical protein
MVGMMLWWLWRIWRDMAVEHLAGSGFLAFPTHVQTSLFADEMP